MIRTSTPAATSWFQIWDISPTLPAALWAEKRLPCVHYIFVLYCVTSFSSAPNNLQYIHYFLSSLPASAFLRYEMDKMEMAGLGMSMLYSYDMLHRRHSTAAGLPPLPPSGQILHTNIITCLPIPSPTITYPTHPIYCARLLPMEFNLSPHSPLFCPAPPTSNLPCIGFGVPFYLSDNITNRFLLGTGRQAGTVVTLFPFLLSMFGCFVRHDCSFMPGRRNISRSRSMTFHPLLLLTEERTLCRWD